jgi:peptide/nickel transport system substrate-binding protein
MHGSSGNRARYTNTEVDALLDRARREVAADRRIGMLKQVERRIVADAPWIFLSHKQTQLLVKPYVRNFTLTAMDVGTSVNQVDFHKVSLGAAE